MTDQAQRAGHPHAQEDHAVARHQPVHIEAEAGARAPGGGEHPLGPGQINGLGDLDVALVAFDQRDRDRCGLGQRGIVRHGGAGEATVRCQDRRIAESLGRLRAIEAGSVDRADDGAVRGPLEGVDHG